MAVGGRVPEFVRGVVHNTLVDHCVVSGGDRGQLWRAVGNWLGWGRLLAWVRTYLTPP